MTKSNQASSRADDIRLRRSRRSHRRTGSNATGNKQKSRAESKPPVMMRGWGSSDSVSSRRKGTRTRRRYDVALSTPGAEIRLPSLPVVHFGWRLVSGLLVGMLAFTLYSIWNAPMYIVSAVEVEGLRRLSSFDINAVANVTGKSVFEVDPQQINRDLQLAFMELESVSVDITLPAVVKVSVVERQPVLVWEEDGRSMWIDSKGVAFPPRGEEGPSILVRAEDVPLSSPSSLEADEQGESMSRYLPPHLVSAILAISTQAPENTPLVYTNDHGLGWRDSRGWEVYFGMDTDDMEMKLRLYKTLVKSLKKEKIQPELISVEYVHAPYFRMER